MAPEDRASASARRAPVETPLIQLILMDFLV